MMGTRSPQDKLFAADRILLGLAAEAQAAHPEQAEGIAAAAALLERLMAQDVEEKPEGGCQIKEGTAKDRVVSVEGPEMRHGHKSARERFNGHQAAVAVDLESQLISGWRCWRAMPATKRKRWSWCIRASG